ncbi:MAG: hypothetical protein OXL96_05675 [Candidatus Poribacteria bacterium]|nr:hypothetical protein [Candidatus Poribacteria bacterium]
MLQLDFNSLVSSFPFPQETEREALASIQSERKANGNGSEPPAPRSNRPVHHLSDAELFAKILAVPITIAEKVLAEGNDDLKYLAGSSQSAFEKNVTSEEVERLAAAFELGKRMARAHAEKEKITAPADVADLLMSKLRYLQKEVVVVLCLDTKGQVTCEGKQGAHADELQWGKIIGESTVFEGTLNATVFHPREIFRFAIEQCANSIILVHNHPSGDPQPSQEDIRATKQAIEAGNQIGIKVLDHVIIGDGIFVSLKEENFI